jgi:hypothetical protein
VVLDRQVGREESHRGQVHSPVRQQLEHDRETPRDPSDFDAVVGLALGHAERIPAIDEQGRIALANVHVAGVQLRQMRDDGSGILALARQGSLESGDECPIGEATEGNEDVVLHAGVVAPAPDTLSGRPLRVDP